MESNTYRKPSYYDVFKHTLKSIGSNAAIKKTNTGYQTATSYKNSIQKVYFDIKNELIVYKSMHGYQEAIDRKFKVSWLGNGRVTFKEIN